MLFHFMLKMENVRKYKSLIKFAIRSSQQKRIELLSKFNDAIIKTICEIFLNVVEETISVPASVKRDLRKHKQLVFKLVQPNISIAVKKQALIKNKGLVLVPLANIIP